MKEAVKTLLETASRVLSGLEEDPKAFEQARVRFLGGRESWPNFLKSWEKSLNRNGGKSVEC